jgi:hypothetical protein
MIRYVVAFIVAGFIFLQVQPVFSQPDGYKKSLLKANPAHSEFKETVVTVDGDPFKGSKDAKLAVIEFSDYQ